MQQELERTREWKDLWYAGWWATWPHATPEQRVHWARIYHERLQRWLRE